MSNTITERNAARTSAGRDPACDKCGWWCKRVWEYSNNECDPKLGRIADALAGMLSDVPATKLGYGHGKIVFEPVAGDDALNIRFNVHRDGTFRLEDVFHLGSMKVDAAADLVRVIAAWRERHAPTQRSKR